MFNNYANWLNDFDFKYPAYIEKTDNKETFTNSITNNSCSCNNKKNTNESEPKEQIISSYIDNSIHGSNEYFDNINYSLLDNNQTKKIYTMEPKISSDIQSKVDIIASNVIQIKEPQVLNQQMMGQQVFNKQMMGQQVFNKQMMGHHVLNQQIKEPQVLNQQMMGQIGRASCRERVLDHV